MSPFLSPPQDLSWSDEEAAALARASVQEMLAQAAAVDEVVQASMGPRSVFVSDPDDELETVDAAAVAAAGVGGAA